MDNFIGKFLEYDGKVFSNTNEKYMRIRVIKDIRKPLKRLKHFVDDNNMMFYLTFQYEKLKTFVIFAASLAIQILL